MTTGLRTEPPPAVPARTRPATPQQLAWLGDELPLWRAAGLVDDRAAAAILRGYHPSRRFDLSRLLLTLGAAFVGVGVIWLVASNLDQLTPLVRFAVVAAFWLALLIGGELLAKSRDHGGAVRSPVVGCVRILAALTFGAVIFQAAQSLQVPAYEPQLLAWWGLGALVHAYVVRGTGPLVIGLLTLTSWLVWQSTWDAPSPLAVLLVLFAGGTLAAAAAAWHEDLLPAFAAPWRAVGAVLALGSLFAAALPFVTTADFAWTPTLAVIVGVCGLAAAASALLARGELRLEPLVSLGIAMAGVLLVLWDGGAASWGHAAAGVLAYVGAAAWYAVLGVLRDSRLLTFLATAALVLFTTVQAFAVFAPILQGAWLFLLLGLVLAGTGWVADRARRELARTLTDEGATR
jgi:uncharacterized membrane protein